MAACVAVLSLMRTLELEFLQPLPRPILQEMELLTPFNKDLIQSLHQRLRFMMELFDKNRMDGVEAIKELETKLRDVAFRVEDEIESQIAHLHETEEEFGIGTPQGDTDDAQKSSTPSFKLGLSLQQGMEDIDAVEKELVKIKNEYTLQGTPDVEPLSIADAFQPVVGRHKDFEIIKKMLTYGSEPRKIVSICGMGGIGKTMLARQIYNDQLIAHFFYPRLWVVASQHHNVRQMLLGLLNSIDYANSSTRDKDDEDLALRLYQRLKGLRYLIVIDDVWSIEAWDAINRCFPDDDKCGGRVLLTTRIARVAYYAGGNNDCFHQMHLLNQSESLDLFWQTVWTSWRVNLETIARLIVEKCRGLPFAVILASLLVSRFDDPDELLENIPTFIAEECSSIFSLDYNHLPYNLKACFLYLGVFPEGRVIYVKDLVRLWASEGLIKEFEDQSLDEVGERWVRELMDRNLILKSKLSYCGGKIKAFKMHGLQHAFCVRQAEIENLLQVVGGNGFNFCVKGFRWLSIQSTDFDDETRTLLHSSSSTCRSIFCFSEAKSLHLKSFNLLRVFYFSDASMCKKIVDLVHLRYLPEGVRGDFRIIKLLKAWNLQTLLDDGRNKSKKFGQQQDSQCPSELELKPCDCTIDFFLKTKYLKVVRITGERRYCNDCIDNLVFLPQLREVYINANVRDYRTPERISINTQIAGLKSLVELSFQSMNFEWEGINVLCQLPRLKVLRLLFSSIGKEWELSEEDVFHSLVYFEIFSTNLKHWKASNINFLRLERLLLRDCFRLTEIPDSFAHSWTLKSIELTRCLPSAVNSANQIQAEKHDYGFENMVVIEKETIQPRSDEDDVEES